MSIKISIVSSMYNKKLKTLEIIEKLFLPSILKNASKEMEFILIDDCSPLSKETDALIKKFSNKLKGKLGNFTYRKNKTNLGFSGSYNEGLKRAKGELILVTNDDVYFPQGSVDALCTSASSDSSIGVLGPVTNWAASYQNTSLFPRLTSYSKREIIRIEEFNKKLNSIMKGKKYEVDKLLGFCVVYRRYILNKVGYFDTRFKYGNFEDDDLHFRIRNAGYKLILDASIFVEHGGIRGGSNSLLQNLLKTYKLYFVNATKYALKHRIYLRVFYEAFIRNPLHLNGYFTITSKIKREEKESKLKI